LLRIAHKLNATYFYLLTGSHKAIPFWTLRFSGARWINIISSHQELVRCKRVSDNKSGGSSGPGASKMPAQRPVMDSNSAWDNYDFTLRRVFQNKSTFIILMQTIV